MPLENIVDSLYSCLLSPELTLEYFLAQSLSIYYQYAGFVLTMIIGSLFWMLESSVNVILSDTVRWEPRPHSCL